MGANEGSDRPRADNARLIHPPFFEDQEQWTAPATIPMGRSGAATGSITYEKNPPAPSDPPHLVRVDVTGVVTNEKKTGKQTVTSRYIITGKQTYDKRLRAWVEAEWLMDISGASYEARGKVDSSSIAMTLQVKTIEPGTGPVWAGQEGTTREGAMTDRPDAQPTTPLNTSSAPSTAGAPAPVPAPTPEKAGRPSAEAGSDAEVQQRVRVPIEYDAGFAADFPIQVMISGGDSFMLEPGGRLIKRLERKAHTLRIVDPKTGFLRQPNWSPYELTLDLTTIDEPEVVLKARHWVHKYTLSVTILSGGAEIDKYEIRLR